MVVALNNAQRGLRSYFWVFCWERERKAADDSKSDVLLIGENWIFRGQFWDISVSFCGCEVCAASY